MRLAFAGTPSAAVPALRALVASPRHEIAAVITRPRARGGRGRQESGSPIEWTAAQADLPVLSPARLSDPAFIGRLADLGVDCCAVVAFGALIPEAALAVPKHGWVNLHFSLLPAWRGAAPVQHAILHGDEVTGATTFRLETGLDTGPVYGVVTESIRPWDTAGDVVTRLADSGASLLVATMDGIEDGSLQPRPQPSDGVSVAPKINVEDARIDWAAPAQHIDRLARACTPAPGAWTTFRDDRLKLGPLCGTDESLPVGELAASKDRVLVGSATQALELHSVQPSGRKAMSALDWARGARLRPGDRLG